MKLKIVFFGLSITSSWGNGHATTYRGLIRRLAERGHEVTFFEHDKPWYRSNRDLPDPPFCRTILYDSLNQVQHDHERCIREADMVIVGSYVPEAIPLGRWINRIADVADKATAFYDIDTPITLSSLEAGHCRYLTPELIRQYDLYLSFTGGPTLRYIEEHFGSPKARPLYCSVDTDLYYPEFLPPRYDLGYLGTYSDDRQPAVERLLLEPARQWTEGRFIVAGPQYPDTGAWPSNVTHVEHLAPSEHRRFYSAQRFTLNVTRADMIARGYSPSVRLFEAAACGVPIISDYWKGMDEFFELHRQILICSSTEEMVYYLKYLPETKRREIGESARRHVVEHHSARRRAEQLEQYIHEVLAGRVLLQEG